MVLNPTNILTRQQLESISPESVANYLEATGWEKQKEEDNFGSLWVYSNETAGEVSTFLPLNRDYIDYTIEMNDVFATLEYVTNTPREDIFAIVKNSYELF